MLPSDLVGGRGQPQKIDQLDSGVAFFLFVHLSGKDTRVGILSPYQLFRLQQALESQQSFEKQNSVGNLDIMRQTLDRYCLPSNE